MKRLLALYFLSAFLVLNYAQEYPEKGKNYDVQIYDYLLTKTNEVPLDTFLTYSKPFSKWDIRPLYRGKIWVFDTIYTAGEIPNFIWGAIAAKYNVTLKAGKDFPNRFLKKGIDKRSDNINILKDNLSKFEEITEKIQSGDNLFFINQNSMQRIDEIYREDSRYWKYIIPSDSPFPISDSTITTIDITFSESQNQILDLLKELNIYCAVKTTKGIFYLIDGFTDNSYGFYFSREGKMENDNFLFHILASEKVNPGYFYYVAN